MQEKQQTIPQMVDEVRSGKLPRRQFMRQLTAMGVSSVGVGAIVAAAVSPSSEAPVAKVNVSENATKHLEMHDQHMSHQVQGNASALHYDYAEHAVVEDSMYPAPITGRAAIIARKTMGFAATTDAQITVVNRIAVGNQVTVEWIATGIHTGDLPGLPATGRSYTLRGVTVVIREGGKIVRESLYYDAADLYRQLGQTQ
jgi:steroid delta-isomerase-like uncharacterized protein